MKMKTLVLPFAAAALLVACDKRENSEQPVSDTTGTTTDPAMSNPDQSSTPGGTAGESANTPATPNSSDTQPSNPSPSGGS